MIFSKLTILVALMSGMVAHAQTATVLVRGNKFAPQLVERELPNLVSTDSFDGQYFKMVEGKSEEAIPFNHPDLELRLRAATAYYHLNLARDYWVNLIHSDHATQLPKITVRLDIKNNFSELGHFQNDAIEPQYNNALSIPAGKPLEGVIIPAWGNEIWFRPMKKIRTTELPGSGLGGAHSPLTEYIGMLSDPVESTTLNRFIQVSLQKIFYPETLTVPYSTSVFRQAGTIAVMSLILRGSKHTDKWFLEKYYYLDTAMIPEIIYHEYSHIALTDSLDITHSTPVLEGMADYFATSLSNQPQIAGNIKKYSLSAPKNGHNKQSYHSALELSYYANSDFVLSVLWMIRDHFPEVADQLIFKARKDLDTETSTIRHDLIAALLKSCSSVCKDPQTDQMKMRILFEKKGF